MTGWAAVGVDDEREWDAQVDFVLVAGGFPEEAVDGMVREALGGDTDGVGLGNEGLGKLLVNREAQDLAAFRLVNVDLVNCLGNVSPGADYKDVRVVESNNGIPTDSTENVSISSLSPRVVVEIDDEEATRAIGRSDCCQIPFRDGGKRTATSDTRVRPTERGRFHREKNQLHQVQRVLTCPRRS